jgi:hypothetical protein
MVYGIAALRQIFFLSLESVSQVVPSAYCMQATDYALRCVVNSARRSILDGHSRTETIHACVLSHTVVENCVPFLRQWLERVVV